MHPQRKRQHVPRRLPRTVWRRFLHSRRRRRDVPRRLSTRVRGCDLHVRRECGDLSERLPQSTQLPGDIIVCTTSLDPSQPASLTISCLSDEDREAYSSGSGTSFSSPLIAGGAALLLEAHPGWSPTDILEALRSTASNADSPDNSIGWGIPDAALANAVPIGTAASVRAY